MPILAGAVVAGVVLLAAGTYAYFADHDWHTEARVDGTTINRAQLRDRAAVIGALQSLAALRVRAAGPAQAAAIGHAFDGDPLGVARSQLIDEILLDREASRRGIHVTGADVALELARAVNEPASIEVRWLSLVATGHPPSDIEAVTETADHELGAATEPDPSRIAAALPAMWQATAGQAWLGAEGPAALDATGPPPQLTIAARAASSGQVLAPIDDGLGHRILGRVVSVAPGVTVGPALRDAAMARGASDAALEAWARGQNLRRAMAEALAQDAASAQVDQVHLRELVLGPTVPGPEMVELSALTVARLGPGDPQGRGLALAATLAGLAQPLRVSQFKALAMQANGGGSPTPAERSGEIGWFARDGLLTAVGDAAFAPGRRIGDVIGPIATPAGPQLFLIEAKYAGSLDDRAGAIAIEALDPLADLAGLAGTVAPRDVQRADVGVWRILSQFDDTELADSGLAAAGVGDPFGPLDVEGEAVVGRVLGRRSAPADPREVAVVQLEGLDDWLRRAIAAAAIVLTEDPLGGGSPSPNPGSSEAPGGSRLNSIVSAQPPPFGLPSPFLPTPP